MLALKLVLTPAVMTGATLAGRRGGGAVSGWLIATTIGARVTGLLAVYPLYSAVLAAFAHRLHGRAAAVGLLRGLLVGLFSFAAFSTMLAFLLVRTGIGASFAGAVAAALVVQAASIGRLRVPC